MNYVKSSKPDGYTIGFTAIGPSAVTPNRTNSGYNTVEDFETISHISSTPYAISVNGDSDVKSLDDLMEMLKAEEVNYGSTGAGLHTHLVIEKFLDDNGVDPAHISSSGASGSVTALLGKHIDFAALSLPDVVPYHESGDFRTIAVGTESSVDALPDVPTFKEQGYEFVSGAWFGVLAPKGTPEDIIKTLDEAVKESLMDEKIVKAFDDIGLNIDYKNHEEFREVLESDYKEVGDIVNR